TSTTYIYKHTSHYPTIAKISEPAQHIFISTHHTTEL
ncbi:hypothetical protein LEMLEM_LOCUS1091, partial [Lemmus lemmus]